MLQSLRHRLLAALAVTAVAAITLQVAFAAYMILPRLIVREDQQAHNAIDQILSVVHSKLTTLGGETRDWASWDQSVDFVTGRMPEYPDSNFSEDMLRDTHHMLMAYFDINNQPFWIVGIDPATNTYHSCTPHTLDCRWAEAFTSLLQPHLATMPDELDTWLASTPVPTMVAVSPILPTERDEATHSGWLAMFERIDDELITTIGKQTGQDSITIYPSDLSWREQGHTHLMRTGNVLDATHYLAGNAGTPLLEINTRLSRAEFRQNRQNFILITAGIVVLYLIAMLIVILLVETMVLKPTRTLHDTTRTLRRQIHTNMDLPERLTSRRDELGNLARSFQQLINEERARSTSLLKQTRTDELTGLYNRREFDETLETCLMNPAHYYPVSIILIDIDHFKLYNDHFGHPEGDQCLINVARLMKACFNRPDDLVARTGGEEFSVLLPHTSAEEALTLGTRLQNRLKQRDIAHPASPTARWLTLSMGISYTDSTDHRSPRHLIKAADVALYAAKARGRNRVLIETEITRPRNEA